MPKVFRLVGKVAANGVWAYLCIRLVEWIFHSRCSEEIQFTAAAGLVLGIIDFLRDPISKPRPRRPIRRINLLRLLVKNGHPTAKEALVWWVFLFWVYAFFGLCLITVLGCLSASFQVAAPICFGLPLLLDLLVAIHFITELRSQTGMETLGG